MVPVLKETINLQDDVDDLLASIRKAATVFHEIQESNGVEPQAVVIAALWLATLPEHMDMSNIGDAYSLILSRLGVPTEFLNPELGAHC